jgi:hypothetical protein
MIDADDTLRAELHRLVPIDSRRDWDEVVATSGLKRERARRRWAIGAAVAVAAVAVGVATPLGAAIGRGLDDFSAWLTGEPGTPASEREQQAFEAANARSWLRFPQGTRLRHLITAKAGAETVELLGFRAGSGTLCLRLSIKGDLPGRTMSCAPLAELRRSGGPARVLIADFSLGKGRKKAWYGIDRLQSSKLQITAGIAADGVRSIVLEDDTGRHDVPVSSNAFLHVLAEPEVGQRVKRVWARSEGGLVPVPFAPTPFGIGPGSPSRPAPSAPAIERKVEGGRIGWLEEREARGESLDVVPPGGLPGRARENAIFGRVLTPDPDRPFRMVVAVNTQRANGLPATVCVWPVTHAGGTSGGCMHYSEAFDRGPILASASMRLGSDAFIMISGVASDDVARIDVLLADGQRAEVPLQDNAFVVDLPRANLPGRFVAYDDEDRVIGVTEPWDDFGMHAGPARGRAKLLLRVSGPDGVRAELFIGPSTDGGECFFMKEFFYRKQVGVSVGCGSPRWSGQALQLGASWTPPRLVSGRVRPDVRRVRVRFADGSTTTLTPTRGYVLWAVPHKHVEAGSELVAFEGLDDDGNVLGRQSWPPPTSSHRSSSGG